jgi:UDP-N-acetylglucosamine acyltransferase
MPIDPSAMVAPTARVHPEAWIGPQTVIGDYCVIEQDVRMGIQCRLDPYVFVRRWTTLGDRNEISAGVVLGSHPLDKHFTGERSYLRIGNGNKIREHFTISRATTPEAATEIGDDNFIMTGGHIAHDVRIGNGTVLVCGVQVGGHAQIEDQVFIAEGAGIHQHSKVGRLAMIGGHTRVTLDAPPFFLYSSFDIKAKGLNVVGLRRAGFTQAEISALKSAYRMLYRSGLKLEEALSRIEAEIPGEHTRHLVGFIRGSKRGICREERS